MTTDSDRPNYQALLLDIGDVITSPLWDQFDELGVALGVEFVGRGPLDPSGDDLWQRCLAGESTYHEYWMEYASLHGYAGWRDLYRDITIHLPHRFGDPAAYALLADAQDAGFKVGVLTNDGVGISGPAFFDRIPEFQRLDAFVDARLFGLAKPDPEPYLRAATALDVAPEQIVFLDDALEYVEGAKAVGMTGVLVNPLDKAPAFGMARSLLGLGERA